ncbi:hypothetical protein BHE90_016894 [Fusarium euwallaceae]|uniref:Uncharacterized protein n=4 Tax=Fusarium solani species complex TaxID=232080 RepID=A0A3M2S1T0_9HYPO|nr:hypothetical protein CDV36_008886 [Fusarium kuroshium]RSL96968.1 hypothetical protein CDV31_013257 [Fusarium ambrosium]RSM06311.1 hypothetical protein CEP52_005765 [Fusarium oligoseptatum]RTE68731.1 hypothetical protein BHE90_016894 [Fusarium euwallaceae]
MAVPRTARVWSVDVVERATAHGGEMKREAEPRERAIEANFRVEWSRARAPRRGNEARTLQGRASTITEGDGGTKPISSPERSFRRFGQAMAK